LAAIPVGDELTRETQLKLAAGDDEPDLQIPELNGAETLVDIIKEIGFTKHTGDRLVPIDMESVRTWMQINLEWLSPGEVEALMTISAAYVDQHYKSQKRSCPSPNLPELPNRETVERKIKDMFSVMKNG